jgi:exonuclease SbcC
MGEIMITKVRLKNWRSHLDSEFRFSRGTNALFGGMGSGKTSVLNGICFALFGNFPDLQSKKVKLDEIIMNKPVEKNKAEVEVFFEANGKTYSVKRVIERGRGTTYSEFREEGKLIEAPNSLRVTEMVEKVLKVDYELFTRAIYSEQNALDYFLTIPKGQRMKKIDELLMIDKFEEARANAKTLTNRLIDRKSEKQRIIDQVDLESLEKNISELKNSLAQINLEMSLLEKSLKKISDQKKVIEKEASELRELNKSLESLKREEKGMNSAIEETLKNLKILEECLKGKAKEEVEKNLEEFENKLKELEKVLKEKKELQEKLSSSIYEVKARAEVLKNKIEELEEEVKSKINVKDELENLKSSAINLKEKIEEKKLAYEKFIGEIKGIESKLQDLKEGLEKLSSVEGKCPLCDSLLTEERRTILIKEKEKQINEFSKRLEEAKRNKVESEKELKEMEEIEKKIEKLEDEVKDLGERQKDLENSKMLFEKLKEEVVKKEKDFDELKREVEKIEELSREMREKIKETEIIAYKFKDYEERKKRLDELMEEAKRIEAKIYEIEEKISGRNLEEIEKELREISVKEKEIEEKIFGLKRLEEEKRERVKEYEDKLSSIKKEKEEVKKLEKIITDLKIFEIALKQTQEEMRVEFVETVNYEMNKLWPTLYPYRDFSEIKLNIEEGDYVLQLRDKSGRFINVDGIASGGERSVACLALRIAFARVLAPQLRWLVLDEPTHNLDAKAVEDLAVTLKTRVGELVDQVFLISHEERLEDAVTGFLYRLERDKEKDEPTRVIAS